MDIFNNWLFQSIFSNFIWAIIVIIIKWFHSTPKKEKLEIEKDKDYSKRLVKNQFNICFWISSVSTILITIIVSNNFQDNIPFLFTFLIIAVFWCYIFMLGSFEAALKYMPDDKFKKK